MSVPLKALVAVAVVVIFGASAALTFSAFSGGEVKQGPAAALRAAEQKRNKRFAELEAEAERVRHQRGKEREVARRHAAKRAHLEAAAASAGSNGTAGQSPDASSPTAAGSGALAGSFAELEGQISGSIGVAFAPLGSTSPEQIGSLTEGHAWSSFKVPITVTLMEQQNDSLSSEQQSLAASAITASDNEAAAALFQDLEDSTGGAAAAIEGVLAQSGSPTQVATAPPPPGAVSSWGQTDWTLSASTDFYGALACNRLLSSAATESVLNLMEQVIPEQQWGLGQASFPSGTRVAFKAGWGPDGSESGPYLVRQAGVLRSADGTGAVVTIAAQDAGGSFEAGVADLDQVADWVAQNVPLREGGC